MTCDQYRDQISARHDGELAPSDLVGLEAHVAQCDDCREYDQDLAALETRLHLAAELGSIPTGGSAPRQVSLGALGALRWLLFIVGGTLIVLNISNLVFDVDAVDPHLSRHDAVFGSALGIGMVSVAARPQRAIGLVTLTSTIAVLMAVVAIADVLDGQRTMLAEAIHVLEFTGLVCLWVISGGVSRFRSRLASMLRVAPGPTVPEWPTS